MAFKPIPKNNRPPCTDTGGDAKAGPGCPLRRGDRGPPMAAACAAVRETQATAVVLAEPEPTGTYRPGVRPRQEEASSGGSGPGCATRTPVRRPGSDIKGAYPQCGGDWTAILHSVRRCQTGGGNAQFCYGENRSRMRAARWRDHKNRSVTPGGRRPRCANSASRESPTDSIRCEIKKKRIFALQESANATPYLVGSGRVRRQTL